MTQKPIERRIATLLSTSTTRTSTSRWLGGLATTIALLIVVGVCSIRPFSPLAIAATAPEVSLSDSQDSESNDLDFPSRLNGVVVDDQGKPIAGAELHLTATPRPKSEYFRNDYIPATIDLPVVKTDGEGLSLIHI